jgi:putative FmdB family regulatory protein
MMPTYDYLCGNCNHEVELFQKITDPPATKCPNCGKKKLKRQISGGAGIIFKGSGWTPKESKSPDAGQRRSDMEKLL